MQNINEDSVTIKTRDEITPVEKRGQYLFKRDDLYRPYDFCPVNGSKLRQCELLIEKNIDVAHNGVITGTSILSPQSAIVSAVAKANGIPCTVYFGGTTKGRLAESKYPSYAIANGANVEIVSKSGLTSVLTSKANAAARDGDLFHIRYGMDLIDNADVFLESTARQVSNLPDEIDNLVITVGSAITILGVLHGLLYNGKRVKNIYAVGVAPNRMEKIRMYADLIEYEMGDVLPVDLIRYVDGYGTMRGFKYENTISESYHGITFHPRYEAKTFRWLRQQELDGETIMWITGSDF